MNCRTRHPVPATHPPQKGHDGLRASPVSMLYLDAIFPNGCIEVSSLHQDTRVLGDQILSNENLFAKPGGRICRVCIAMRRVVAVVEFKDGSKGKVRLAFLEVNVPRQVFHSRHVSSIAPDKGPGQPSLELDNVRPRPQAWGCYERCWQLRCLLSGHNKYCIVE